DVRNDDGPVRAIGAPRGRDPAGGHEVRAEAASFPWGLAALAESLAAGWAKARSSFELAVRSLWLHKLRSMLSVLGIIIGTASVIALMAFGRGSMEDALEDIRRQGTNKVIVRSIKPVDTPASARPTWVVNYGLTWNDFEDFRLIDTVVGMVPS